MPGRPFRRPTRGAATLLGQRGDELGRVVAHQVRVDRSRRQRVHSDSEGANSAAIERMNNIGAALHGAYIETAGANMNAPTDTMLATEAEGLFLTERRLRQRDLHQGCGN